MRIMYLMLNEVFYCYSQPLSAVQFSFLIKLSFGKLNYDQAQACIDELAMLLSYF